MDTSDTAAILDHLDEHCMQQPGDCATTRDLRNLLILAVATARGEHTATMRLCERLDAIAALEVHGREFVDAAQLYKILDLPIPEPIDHAANIRAKHVSEEWPT